jgi:hypothetical protein
MSRASRRPTSRLLMQEEAMRRSGYSRRSASMNRGASLTSTQPTLASTAWRATRSKPAEPVVSTTTAAGRVPSGPPTASAMVRICTAGSRLA